MNKHDVDWKLDAACAVLYDSDGQIMDPIEKAHIFYPPGQSGPGRPRLDVRAKAICRVCPVKKPCLEYAITNREVGVWGGMDDDDRNKEMLRRRRSVI